MSTALGTAASPAPAPAPVRRRRRVLPRLLLGLAALILLFSVVEAITGATELSSPGTIGAALGLAVPIGMAGLGGLWAERAGVVNIGLEGMMILGTWGAGWAGSQWGPWAGVGMAVLMGAFGGALHALATVAFGVDHIISGVAINILGFGLATYLAAATFVGVPGGGTNQSPPIPTMGTVTLPGISTAMADLANQDIFFISQVAGILGGLTTNVSYITILAGLLLVLTWWVLWRTPFGLRLRSCGEAPYAAETLGVKVYRYKTIAVVVSGALAGFGGAYLAIVAAQQYREGQTAGRGYIGLAAMIFGNWRPGGLAAGAGLFGYADALQLRSATAVHALLLVGAIALGVLAFLSIRRGSPVGAIVLGAIAAGMLAWYLLTDEVPPQFAFMTPYVTTLLVLSLATQRLRMPAADGQPYRRGGGR
ncbi:MAG: ABC transporter permease [Candidatus Nanopelagicales bacterium]|jgi:simple sugar transport system permease protein|nr:ABC transporter permease [Candidatus Nanopelagicales bacterium]